MVTLKAFQPRLSAVLRQQGGRILIQIVDWYYEDSEFAFANLHELVDRLKFLSELENSSRLGERRESIYRQRCVLAVAAVELKKGEHNG